MLDSLTLRHFYMPTYLSCFLLFCRLFRFLVFGFGELLSMLRLDDLAKGERWEKGRGALPFKRLALSVTWLFKPGCCVYRQVSKHSTNTHHEEWPALSIQGVVLGGHGRYCSEYNTNVGISLPKLQALVQKQVQGSSLLVHAVQDVHPAAPINIGLRYPLRTTTFSPKMTAAEIACVFTRLQPQHNKNRFRVFGTATTVTFGAQTGRGSDKTFKRTPHPSHSGSQVC